MQPRRFDPDADPAFAPSRPSRRMVGVVALAWGVYALLAFASWLFDGREPTTDAVARHLGAPALEAVCWAALTFPILALADRWPNGDGPKRWVRVALAGVVVAGLMGWVNVTLRNAAHPPDAIRPGFASGIASGTASGAASGAGAGGRPPSPRLAPDDRPDAGGLVPGRPPGGGHPHGVPLWLGVVNALTLYLAVFGVGLSRAYSRQAHLRREEAARREALLQAQREEAATLQAQLAEARLDALRRQLDPHFLFNTLNAVSALVERDPRGVRRMIEQLSDLLRHSMSAAAAPEVPLRQELDVLERYVDIMRVRFEDQLEVETRADSRALDALVPNLILQPLVENAIKHGVEQRADGGRVEIDATLDGDTLMLRVWDEGPDVPPWRAPAARARVGTGNAAGGGVGLENTAARLAHLYGAAHRLALGPAPEGGTVVEIRLPYHTTPYHTTPYHTAAERTRPTPGGAAAPAVAEVARALGEALGPGRAGVLRV